MRTFYLLFHALYLFLKLKKNISNYAKNYEITNILSRYQYYGKKLAKKQNIKKRMKKPEDFNTIMEEYQTKEQKAIQRVNI